LFYQNEADNKIDKIQIQKNMRIAEGNVKDAIMETIRNLLPIKDVLGSILEMNEDGGVVVEIANQSKKETLVKESSLDEPVNVNTKSSLESVETKSQIKSQPLPQLKQETQYQPDAISRDKSSSILLEEVQKGFEKSKPLSFQEAELGNIPGKSKFTMTESKTDDTFSNGAEDGDENDDEGDGLMADELSGSGFDWNTIVVGPVDDTIESSMVEDIESIDPPVSNTETDTMAVDDILGAVEEL
jgi:hypothetical protein